MQHENPAPGSYLAWCIGLIDMGTQAHTFQGETSLSRDVRLVFELCGTTMTGKYNPDLKGKPFGVSTTCRQSLHKNSRLRALLEAWRGRKFSPEELQSFDPKKLLGKPARLTLVQSEDGSFVNIQSIAPVHKDELKSMPKRVNPLVYFSLDPEEFKPEVFEKLSEGTKKRISESPEYRALTSADQDHYIDAEPPEDLDQEPPLTNAPNADIPF